MSTHCCPHDRSAISALDPRYRRALWVALVLNVLMFVVELGASWTSGSVSLLADSIDFFGDAGNYAISLAVLGMAMSARSKAALFKAACMGAFGVFVLGKAAWNLQAGVPPEPATMGAVGFAALAVNAGVALMLYRFRAGDANMRSVWICSRNDALGNVAVMLAALGVFGTGSAWPDLLVAAVMGVLALTGSWAVGRQARTELQTAVIHGRAGHCPLSGDGSNDASWPGLPVGLRLLTGIINFDDGLPASSSFGGRTAVDRGCVKTPRSPKLKQRV